MNLVDSIFLSKERFLQKKVQEYNQMRAFNNGVITLSAFKNDIDNELFISGGRHKQRAQIIVEMISREISAEKKPVVVLYSNNASIENQMNEDGVKFYALNQDDLDYELSEFLAVLSSDNTELIPFWAWAYEVLKTLNKPISLSSLNTNWLSMEWQHELLSSFDYDKAIDLITRYNNEMSKLAAEAMTVLEQISRKLKKEQVGKTLKEAFAKNLVICGEMNGNQSKATRQCLDIVLAEIEQGKPCLLVLENVLVKDHPIFLSNTSNLKLILSAADLCTYTTNINELTTRNKVFMVLKHSSAESADLLSRKIFGQYDSITFDMNINRNINGREHSIGTSTHVQERKYRLDPLLIMAAKEGIAYVKSYEFEGVVQI